MTGQSRNASVGEGVSGARPYPRAANHAGEPDPATAADSSQVLLIGPDGESLRPLVEVGATAQGLGVSVAESFLEAVLISGHRRDAGGAIEPVSHPLILAGIAQEIEQLEPAVRSLRQVNPRSMMVLLCDSGDEVLARRAKGWGADDYAILPVSEAELAKLLERAIQRCQRPSDDPPPSRSEDLDVMQAGADARAAEPGKPSRDSNIAPAQLVRQVVELDACDGQGGRAPAASPRPPMLQRREAPGRVDLRIPQLPLVVQTVMMNDLLAGRVDIAERAVATLEGYLRWSGRLRFVPARPDIPAGPESAANPLRLCSVVAVPPMTFGELVLELSDAASGSQALLDQAAAWIGAMLALSRRYEQLRSLAITDELSGAYNRRYFVKFVNGLLDRARLSRFRVSLLLFDIDDFKQYNDNFGHAAGDAIIRDIVKLMRTCTRPHDLVARIGGDEFAVVFWDNDAPRQPNSEHPRDAVTATARFRKTVENHQWGPTCNIQGKVSISGGLATFPWDADNLDLLMAKADEALLRAKAAGKNVILLHGDDSRPVEEIGEQPQPPD